MSGEILFAVGLLTLFGGLVALASADAAQRRWARAAAIAGVITSVGFIGAALTPADRFLQLHLQSALLAFRGGLLSALLLAVLIVRDRRFSSRAAIACVLTALVLAGYLVTLQWGPRVNTDFGLLVQATAQKIVFIAAVPSLSYISWEARRISANTNRSS